MSLIQITLAITNNTDGLNLLIYLMLDKFLNLTFDLLSMVSVMFRPTCLDIMVLVGARPHINTFNL